MVWNTQKETTKFHGVKTMVKITTLFKKDQSNLGRVINKIAPENKWVLSEPKMNTRQFDGTACAIIKGELHKRFDAKPGRKIPTGAIPCQEPDSTTGHHPHWVKCNRDDSSDKYHFEAFDKYPRTYEDETLELCGEKINNNREKIKGHVLIKHGQYLLGNIDLTFEGIREFLQNNDIEGIVFHEIYGSRMCKIRKSDFGIKR